MVDEYLASDIDSKIKISFDSKTRERCNVLK